ncbi:hypothetical protein F2P79_010252 [Pimephales promelas]|nr:hypothetical protein F2P79_010252 [Pimephales promelas]
MAVVSKYQSTYFVARQVLKKALKCNTSDLQSEEEEEEIQPKRRPKPIYQQKSKPLLQAGSTDLPGGGEDVDQTVLPALLQKSTY